MSSHNLSNVNSSNESPLKTDKKQSQIENEQFIFNKAQSFYSKCLENDNQAHEALKEMGIKDGSLALHLGIGWVDGTFKKTLSKGERQECVKLDLFGPRHEEKSYKGLSFPLYKEREIKGFLIWKPKHSVKALLGERGVMNEEVLEREDLVILVDSPALYAILHQLGFSQTLCLPYPENISETLKSSRVKTIYLNARKDLQGLLQSVEGCPQEIRLVSFRQEYHLFDQKMVNESLNKTKLYEKEKPSEISKRVEHKNGDLILHFEDVTYKVQPLNLTSASLKAIVTAQMEEERFTDRLDLYLSMSRRAFTKACSEKFFYDQSEFERDLHQVIIELEKIRDSKIESQIFSQDLSQSDEDMARQTLMNPSILQEFVTDMKSIGFVGEDNNLKIGFLMSISRLLDKPLSVIVQSSSGTGKSHLLNTICNVTPPESLLFMSKLTPSSLYYMPDLRHKLLCVDEAHGSEGSLYPLRTLQSNHKLVLALPMKDSVTGGTITKQMVVKGPVSFVESTTNDKLHPENASRAIILNMDESPEQTLKILEAQREASQRGFQDRSEIIYKKWQNVQRLLMKNVKSVVIPYVKYLKYPAGPNARRDHQKFLSLIKAITLLKTLQRPVEKDDLGQYIAATDDDYALAFELFVPLMAHHQDELSQRAKDFIRLLKDRDNTAFTRRELMEEFEMSYSHVWRCMKELIAQEILVEEAVSKGHAPKYRLLQTYIPENTIKGLLSPSDLQALFKSSSDKKVAV